MRSYYRILRRQIDADEIAGGALAREVQPDHFMIRGQRLDECRANVAGRAGYQHDRFAAYR